MPRATSLPVDDQQRMHYTQMLSSRNIQQSSLSVPGAFLPMGVDRGAYMLPGASGNGMGMMGGRTMPMSKPGFQGINSPGMPVVSTGSMLASGGVGLPNPANTNSLAVSSPGNSLLRPHDPLPVMQVSVSHQHFNNYASCFSICFSHQHVNSSVLFGSKFSPFLICFFVIFCIMCIQDSAV